MLKAAHTYGKESPLAWVDDLAGIAQIYPAIAANKYFESCERLSDIMKKSYKLGVRQISAIRT